MPSALIRIFNAIPSQLFSAAAELRMINPNHWTLFYVNPDLVSFDLSCSIHPRRLTTSDSFKERFTRARSSMSLRAHLMISYYVRILAKMEENLFVLYWDRCLCFLARGWIGNLFRFRID
jgi:hypothetical protein